MLGVRAVMCVRLSDLPSWGLGHHTWLSPLVSRPPCSGCFSYICTCISTIYLFTLLDENYFQRSDSIASPVNAFAKNRSPWPRLRAGATRAMVQQLMNEPDLDAILQWSVMQKFMDELSETEEEASGSSDDMALGESLVALESRQAPGRRPHPGTSVRRPRRWLIGCIIRHFQVLCLHRPHDARIPHAGVNGGFAVRHRLWCWCVRAGRADIYVARRRAWKRLTPPWKSHGHPTNPRPAAPAECRAGRAQNVHVVQPQLKQGPSATPSRRLRRRAGPPEIGGQSQERDRLTCTPWAPALLARRAPEL